MQDKQNAEWQAEIARLNDQYKVNLQKLTRNMESMRVEKDTEIKRLTVLMEE